MRIETTRVLNLPVPPREAWRSLRKPSGLAALVPELEDAFTDNAGELFFVARFGRRRRSWKAVTTALEPGSRWEVASQTPSVPFQLQATVRPAGTNGSEVRVALSLQPPDAWLAPPKRAIGAARGPLERLALSAVLFAISALGLLVLPRLTLPGTVAALAYGLLGAFFLAAVSTLTGAHRRQQTMPAAPRTRAMVPSTRST